MVPWFCGPDVLVRDDDKVQRLVGMVGPRRQVPSWLGGANVPRYSLSASSYDTTESRILRPHHCSVPFIIQLQSAKGTNQDCAHSNSMASLTQLGISCMSPAPLIRPNRTVCMQLQPKLKKIKDLRCQSGLEATEKRENLMLQ